MSGDIIALARRHKHVAPTHYEGCEADHIGCLVNKLADEIEGLRAKIKWLIEDDERLYFVLYRIANPRPFADCPVEMAQNATRGEHLRREAFDGIRRALEGKP